MRIGIDLDDVLADTVKSFLDFYNKKYSKNFSIGQIKEYGLWKLWGISKEKMIEELDEFLHTDNSIPVVENSKTIINELAKNNELFIITSRLDSTSKPTFAWINKHFPGKFLQVHFAHNWLKKTGKNKEDICKELKINLMVDDSLEFANLLALSGIKVLLLDKNWNKCDNLHSNITRISSLNEILEKSRCFN